LAAVGKWMQQNASTIRGTRGDIVPAQDWGVITKNTSSMFVHILNKKDNNPYLFIPQFTGKVNTAVLFNGKTPVKYKQQPEGLFIYLDGIKLNDIDTIIQLN
jgi:alpha-L-fucosidase